MRDEEAVDLLHGAVALASPSGAESEVADFLATRLSAAPVAAHVDDVGNLIVRAGADSGPTIMLLSHMDTAGAMLPVRRTESVLEGRGTVDAKGPLVAMLAAAARLPSCPARLVVVGAVEEESLSSRGAESLRGQWDVDCVIVGEPSGVDSVVLGYKGKLDLTLTARSPAGHTASPRETAVEQIARAWSAIGSIADVERRGSFWEPAATLLRIDGDHTSASAHVDVRVPPDYDPDEFVVELQRGLPDLRIQVLGNYPAVLHERNNPAARALRVAMRSQGLAARTKVKTGTSDMNTVAKFWDVPMCAYGPGDSRLDHTDNEHILVPDFTHAITILTHALPHMAEELAGPAAEGPDSVATQAQAI